MQQELNLILMEIHLMILSSLGIGYEDVESIKCNPTTNGIDNSYIILLKNTTYTCPNCGSKHIEVHGYYNRKINHKVLSDRNATLVYKVRRFKCNKCQKTFNEANPFAYNNSQISLKTIEEILRKLRYTHATFKMVAQEFGLSVTTIEIYLIAMHRFLNNLYHLIYVLMKTMLSMIKILKVNIFVFYWISITERYRNTSSTGTKRF